MVRVCYIFFGGGGRRTKNKCPASSPVATVYMCLLGLLFSQIAVMGSLFLLNVLLVYGMVYYQLDLSIFRLCQL